MIPTSYLPMPPWSLKIRSRQQFTSNLLAMVQPAQTTQIRSGRITGLEKHFT
jgi:hypothetical protein